MAPIPFTMTHRISHPDISFTENSRELKHDAMKMLKCITILIFTMLAFIPFAGVAEEPGRVMPEATDYTLLWWADGPPHLFSSKLTPATGILCLQSGLWGLAFDTKSMRAVRFGMWKAPMTVEEAVKPGNTALADLPAVTWNCAIIVDGKKFTCTGHTEAEDPFLQPVRFVESGRFFHRVVIEGLKFANSNGKKFPCEARLEISAWPDRLAFRLQVIPGDIPAGSKMELSLGDQSTVVPLATGSSALLEVLGDKSAMQADLKADPSLQVGLNEALGCQTICLPEKPWSNAKGTFYPEEHLDYIDRWPITLQNDSDHPTVVRLMFTQQNAINLTGLVPMLCEPDGTPSGLPVQISKNWHQDTKKQVLLHEGPWFHGCAFVRLAPKSKRDLVFQMVYARYGGVFAASHAQLCLIGWAHNQFWDQAAIGSFGESICFEPGRVQRRCFIDDVRPFLTVPHDKPTKLWDWAGNCGGGDFLMWQDAQGSYQPMRATRTDYRSYGPCLTDVSYTEESAKGELSARVDVSVPRSNDYLRTFFKLRYDVHRPIQWQRLAFFQLGADFYNETPSRKVAIGDASGLIEEWQPKLASDVYDRSGIPMKGNQSWLSIHGLESGVLKPGTAAASRGLIIRSWRAVLGGKEVPQPFASFFCNESPKGKNRTVIELSPPPDLKELLPGDFVEAELELVVFPAEAAAYYGPDKEFQQELVQNADTWRLVQREAAGNDLKIEMHSGLLKNAYPLVFEADSRQCVKAVIHGGLGYVPMTFTGLDTPDGYSLFVDDLRVDQSVKGNDFWQTDYAVSGKRWSQTYNLPFSGQATHTIRFGKK
jgi:hypothetical protein